MRLPIILLLLSLVSLFILNFLGLPPSIEYSVKHALIVVSIGLIGWLCFRIVRKFYRKFLVRVGDQNLADPSQRSLLTQVIFIYRLIVFVIILVTGAMILMTFPYIKNVGVGILGSAGIAGIALGIAARPILLNLMAGFQIAINKTVKIGDVLVVDGETARVESIHLTHIIFLTWDLRRIIVPISRFIDQSFQNWEVTDPEIIGSIDFYCDYQVPIEVLRTQINKLLQECPYWNKRVWKVQVNDCTPQAIQVRVSASANHPANATELKAYLREKIIDFLNKEYPEALPCLRQRMVQ